VTGRDKFWLIASILFMGLNIVNFVHDFDRGAAGWVFFDTIMFLFWNYNRIIILRKYDDV
jgi:hypothetical protein